MQRLRIHQPDAGKSFRLINVLLENPDFEVAEDSLDYLVRDIINMNWWNTAGVLLGYRDNKRIMGEFSETQKRIAVQLKEYYYIRRIAIKDERKFRKEIQAYICGNSFKLEQLNAFSYLTRANPSQYFHRKDGSMTWVDCTSRATYAAKYVFQNGFVDFDGKCRTLGAQAIRDAIISGACEDIGVLEFFVEGDNQVKAECFSQKKHQMTLNEWVDLLKIRPLPDRQWILRRIGHVRTDPYKKFEEMEVNAGRARGNNEALYGFKTSNTILPNSGIISRASRASTASTVSTASYVSRASHVSRVSDVSYVSRASHVSRAIRASNAGNAGNAGHAAAASNAGTTAFDGSAWSECEKAITKPEHLEYPAIFRKNIFGVAGNWKINPNVTKLAKRGWFDPFSGHGTTPLYCKRNGIRYLGFDTNHLAFERYLYIVQDEIENAPGADVRIECFDSTVFRPELVGQFDLCYTSPPYFNFEEYGGNTGHFEGCETYEDFHNKITVPVFRNVFQYLIPGGTLALQTEKENRSRALWIEVISRLGFVLVGSGITGQEKNKYSTQSKRDQSLLLFERHPNSSTNNRRRNGMNRK